MFKLSKCLINDEICVNFYSMTNVGDDGSPGGLRKCRSRHCTQSTRLNVYVKRTYKRRKVVDPNVSTFDDNVEDESTIDNTVGDDGVEEPCSCTGHVGVQGEDNVLEGGESQVTQQDPGSTNSRETTSPMQDLQLALITTEPSQVTTEPSQVTTQPSHVDVEAIVLPPSSMTTANLLDLINDLPLDLDSMIDQSPEFHMDATVAGGQDIPVADGANRGGDLADSEVGKCCCIYNSSLPCIF